MEYSAEYFCGLSTSALNQNFWNECSQFSSSPESCRAAPTSSTDSLGSLEYVQEQNNDQTSGLDSDLEGIIKNYNDMESTEYVDPALLFTPAQTGEDSDVDAIDGLCDQGDDAPDSDVCMSHSDGSDYETESRMEYDDTLTPDILRDKSQKHTDNVDSTSNSSLLDEPAQHSAVSGNINDIITSAII